MIRGLVFVALGIFIAGPSFSETVEAKAKTLFDEGAALIELNHHESMSTTREGLERGIELLRRSVELGYPDTKNAFLELAAALNDLAFTYYQGQEEQFNDLVSYRDLIYQRLLDLYPQSAEVLTENAFVGDNEVSREELLRRAVQADPDYSYSSYLLGMMLIERGEIEEGFPLARRGVENSDALVFLSYGWQLIDLLKSLGEAEKAQEFEGRFKELQVEILQISPQE